MSKRVSHSLLDPYLGPPIKRLYPWLRIPSRFPPEGIVLTGHLFAIVAAVGFAFSTSHFWGGLLIAIGVAGNHVSDCLDGTHARTTGQCRNGGELLDHFVDPLSFSYWLVGWCLSVDRPVVGLAAIIVMYAMAVLTSIKAKMMGEFTLDSFGPTEFKTLLVIYGLLLSGLVLSGRQEMGLSVATGFLYLMLAAGIIQLAWSLKSSIKEVNAYGAPPDTTEWETRQHD